jgi:hypothetical protein
MTEAGWADQGHGRYTYRPGGSTRTTEKRPPVDTDTVTTVENHTVPSPDDTSVNGMLRRLIFLKAAVKAAEGSVKTYKAEIGELDERIRLEWAEDNVRSAGIDGKTAYIYPVFHVEKLDGATPADIRNALEEAGLGYMLQPNYSASALTAYLKELRESGNEPPQALASVVKLVPSSEIRLRDAGARAVPVTY